MGLDKPNSHFKTRKKKLVAFKVVYAKAFDKIAWDFIAATLDKWISLIYECISIVQ